MIKITYLVFISGVNYYKRAHVHQLQCPWHNSPSSLVNKQTLLRTKFTSAAHFFQQNTSVETGLVEVSLYTRGNVLGVVFFWKSHT